MGDAEPAVSAKARADGAAALAQDLLGQSSSDDPEIGALHRRAQIADRGRAALSVARRRLVVADTVLAGTVEIVVARKAELGRRGNKGFADRVLCHIRHAERAAGAVERIGPAHLVLRAPEIGQHILERPPGIAELAPVVEILGLATDIDPAVDRRRDAEHLAARPEDAAVGGTGVGLGLVAPVDARIGEGLAEAQRDVDPAVLVLAAGFEQHHPGRRVFAEPRRDRAPGGSSTDHDKIGLDELLWRPRRVLLRRHLVPLPTAVIATLAGS